MVLTLVSVTRILLVFLLVPHSSTRLTVPALCMVVNSLSPILQGWRWGTISKRASKTGPSGFAFIPGDPASSVTPLCDHSCLSQPSLPCCAPCSLHVPQFSHNSQSHPGSDPGLHYKKSFWAFPNHSVADETLPSLSSLFSLPFYPLHLSSFLSGSRMLFCPLNAPGMILPQDVCTCPSLCLQNLLPGGKAHDSLLPLPQGFPQIHILGEALLDTQYLKLYSSLSAPLIPFSTLFH